MTMVEKKTTKKKIKPVRAPEKPVVKRTEGSAKARKTAARLAAVQVLYQMRLNNQDAKSAVREFSDHRIGFNLDGDVLVPADAEMLEEIVMGVSARWSDIEEMVGKALAQGGKSEIETLLESILRAGAFELIAKGDTDAGVIINDYLNVTTAFYEGSEPKIVNAILDKIAKAVRD